LPLTASAYVAVILSLALIVTSSVPSASRLREDVVSHFSEQYDSPDRGFQILSARS
jgi:hypothetical protein